MADSDIENLLDSTKEEQRAKAENEQLVEQVKHLTSDKKLIQNQLVTAQEKLLETIGKFDRNEDLNNLTDDYI